MSQRSHPVDEAAQVHQGRGAVTNPPNRFEPLVYEPDPEAERDDSAPSTLFFRDPTRQIIASNDSPDILFDKSLNPYRGCEHGCVYCFARPTHEYLGYSAGLDFETRIMVKEDAPELLRKELSKKSWEPQLIAVSGVTDPYQPIERRIELTRRCLGVLAEFRNPTAVITKNHLVSRDADILGELARFDATRVFLSITTVDPHLANIMEPRASTPAKRLEAVSILRSAGVPVGVMVAPVIPGINDHEIPRILEAAAAAGAEWAGYVMLRLPHAVGPIFEAWLEQHFPDRKEKVMNRVREMRGGKMYDPRWKIRQKGEGVFADQVGLLFDTAAKRAGLNRRQFELSADHFRRPAEPQLGLF
ncbi:MAG TPA: PA0069 family radical SAM protein [Thermoanaerobaculia bacterium]|nr:PA0069 family radical SAM protein [Thermoanaerobaculia bacterium]